MRFHITWYKLFFVFSPDPQANKYGKLLPISQNSFEN